MRVNYFLYITKNGTADDFIVDDFLKEHEINDIFSVLNSTDKDIIEIDDFKIFFLVFFVEDCFMHMLKEAGWCPGLIWLDGAGTDVVLWREIKNIVPEGCIIKNSNNEIVEPEDDDIVVYTGIDDNMFTVYIDNKISVDSCIYC